MRNYDIVVQKNKIYKYSQILLNLFVFFLAFPVIEVFGMSITFYLFLNIIILHLIKGLIIFKIDKIATLFFLFFLFGSLSTIFHPPLLKEPDPFIVFKNIMQYLYWVILALYMRTYLLFFDIIKLSKYIFLGLFISVIAFYTFPFQLETPFFTINFKFTRNAFVFNILAFFPLIFWYIKNTKYKYIIGLIIAFFLLSVIFSGGRAGFILILVQFLFILPIIYKKLKSIYYISIGGIFLILILWISLENSPIFDIISKKIELINPRAASLINRSGVEGDLTMDRSWLIRKLMVDKAFEINKEYPVLGIGWFNFTNYGANIYSQNEYERMQGFENEYLNSKSAHNSYAQYIAEGGGIGFILLILILIIAIKPFFYKVISGNFNTSNLPLISLVILLFYFYVISSLTGAITWFIIGMVYATNYNKQYKI
jgi:O-antigen ligase